MFKIAKLGGTKMKVMRYGKWFEVTTEELETEVIMSLTQYDDYKDFCKKCHDKNIESFMSEKEYIKWFNEMWACPDDFKTAYDFCLAWNKN